jgi:hypothetical protein
MGNLFQALSSGLARFVYAWIVPSVLATGVFVVFVMPSLAAPELDPLAGLAAFSFSVLALSVVFAYAALPIYRLLEGYTLPAGLKARLTRRSRRRYARLLAQTRRGPTLSRQIAHEQLRSYPNSVDLVLPTRLGNALKAMETYGSSRFGLDSQSLWYELQSVANDRLRRHTEEARAAVDFFVSSIAHLLALAIISLVVGVSTGDALPMAVSAASAVLCVPAYSQAVRNVGEWHYAVQALVNQGRQPLAESLVLQLPESMAEEKQMWESFTGLVHYGRHDHYLKTLDLHRARPVATEQTAEPS